MPLKIKKNSFFLSANGSADKNNKLRNELYAETTLKKLQNCVKILFNQVQSAGKCILND